MRKFWIRLKVIFSQKEFDSYIDKKAYNENHSTLEELSSKVAASEKRLKSIFESFTNSDTKGIVNPNYNYNKIKVEEIFDFRRFLENNETSCGGIIENTYKVNIINICNEFIALNREIDLLDNVVKKSLSSKILDKLIESGYIKFTKKLVLNDDLSLARNKEHRYRITAELKTFD